MRLNKQYTMSKAALFQRKQAAKKTSAVKVWKTVKVGEELSVWAKDNFGSVNFALRVMRDMTNSTL